MDPALFREDARNAVETPQEYADLGSYTTLAGELLPELSVAYRTWGDPSHPAVLVFHALSGDADCMTWWSRLIGPGRAIDPADYYIICANSLGGCQGTTGPDSIDPRSQRPYGSSFPEITTEDQATVALRLLDRLGVEKLYLAIGGSMGGMQALALASLAPDRAVHVFITASAARHGAFQIAFNEVGRQAILRDPRWRGGDYPESDPPSDGLAVARMIGHCTFLSEAAFDTKFGREIQPGGTEFAVESYLRYQGDKFTRRFSPRSQVLLTKTIDAFDWRPKRLTCRLLSVAYDSDWLYPAALSREIVRLATAAGAAAEHHTLSLPYGHDAFLLDGDLQAERLRTFLGG